MRKAHAAIFGLVLLPAICLAQTAFDGTWRPDPQRPSHPEPESVLLTIEKRI